MAAISVLEHSCSSESGYGSRPEPVVDLRVHGPLNLNLLETRVAGVDQDVGFGGDDGTWNPKRKRRLRLGPPVAHPLDRGPRRVRSPARRKGLAPDRVDRRFRKGGAKRYVAAKEAVGGQVDQHLQLRKRQGLRGVDDRAPGTAKSPTRSARPLAAEGGLRAFLLDDAPDERHGKRREKTDPDRKGEAPAPRRIAPATGLWSRRLLEATRKRLAVDAMLEANERALDFPGARLRVRVLERHFASEGPDGLGEPFLRVFAAVEGALGAHGQASDA